MMALENKVFDDPSPHWYPLQERVREQTVAVLPSLYVYMSCIKLLGLRIQTGFILLETVTWWLAVDVVVMNL